MDSNHLKDNRSRVTRAERMSASKGEQAGIFGQGPGFRIVCEAAESEALMDSKLLIGKSLAMR